MKKCIILLMSACLSATMVNAQVSKVTPTVNIKEKEAVVIDSKISAETKTANIMESLTGRLGLDEDQKTKLHNFILMNEVKKQRMVASLKAQIKPDEQLVKGYNDKIQNATQMELNFIRGVLTASQMERFTNYKLAQMFQ